MLEVVLQALVDGDRMEKIDLDSFFQPTSNGRGLVLPQELLDTTESPPWGNEVFTLLVVYLEVPDLPAVADSKCEPSLGGITGSYEIVAVSA